MSDGYDEDEEMDSLAIETAREEEEDFLFTVEDRKRAEQFRKVKFILPGDRAAAKAEKLENLEKRVSKQREAITRLEKNAVSQREANAKNIAELHCADAAIGELRREIAEADKVLDAAKVQSGVPVFCIGPVGSLPLSLASRIEQLVADLEIARAEVKRLREPLTAKAIIHDAAAAVDKYPTLVRHAAEMEAELELLRKERT